MSGHRLFRCAQRRPAPCDADETGKPYVAGAVTAGRWSSARRHVCRNHPVTSPRRRNGPLSKRNSQHRKWFTAPPWNSSSAIISISRSCALKRRVSRLDLPPWLRVYRRKQHPDGKYFGPSGGYPLVLERLLDWMVAHQDLPGYGLAGQGPDRPRGGRDAHVTSVSGCPNQRPQRVLTSALTTTT